MNKTKKIIFLTVTIFVLFLYNNIVYGADVTFTSSASEISVGDAVTINVNVNAGSWNLSIDGGGLETVGDASGMAGQTSTTANTTISKSYTFNATSEGTYTITLSGDITDYDTEENTSINKQIQIQVVAKQDESGDSTDQDTNSEENNNTNTDSNTSTNTEITFTEVNKTMYVKSDCSYLNVREEASSSSKIISGVSSKNAVTVLAIGSNGWYKIRTQSGIEGYVAGNYLTDTKPTESSIATLSKLEVSSGQLNETFSKDTFEYTMTVEADVDSINVTATPTDSNANVTITGNTGLVTGTGNVISIKVVAEDGTSTRTYKIKVTKLASEDDTPNILEEPEETTLGLSSLEIEGITLNPSFQSNIYEYTSTLTDMSIESLIVNAVSAVEDAKVEIIGADNIKDGENVITITVTSSDGEQTITYQVIVNKEATVVTETAEIIGTNQTNNNRNLIIAIGAIFAIILLIVIFVIIKKKEKSNPVRIYEDGDYNEVDDGMDESSSKTEEKELMENDDISDESYEENEDDEDDDWGTPKRGFRSKFKKTGRHF